MKLDLNAPDHSTLSLRRRHLMVELPVRRTSRARHLLVDSTGIKVYGEGEWKVRQHGWSKRRTWVKLHLCVNESTLDIVSACVTTNNVGDGQAPPDLLATIPGRITQVTGDGGLRSTEVL